MASINKDGYTMERHPGETERLHAQNEFLNKVVGYRLHPDIKAKLPSEPRIAELATATGDFVVTLSSELSPNAKLDAYDISSVSFLPAESLPANVSLNILNAKQPAPAELHGRYDVVCIRFFNIAMMPEDWQVVAEHAAQLLKPGGSLQWIEANFRTLRKLYKSNPDTKSDEIEKWACMLFDPQPMERLEWFVGNLEGVLNKAGFQDIEHYRTSTDRDTGSEENQKLARKNVAWMAEGAIYSILLRLVRAGTPGLGSEDDINKAHEVMLKEIESGAYPETDIHQFVAFKKS